MSARPGHALNRIDSHAERATRVVVHAHNAASSLLRKLGDGPLALVAADRADIYSIFGPTNVAIHGVQVAVELHRGRDAVRRSHQVDSDRLPPSLLERRGQFLVDVAHGHVLEGANAQAVALLLRADHIAPQEVRLSPEVHVLTRTLLGRERIEAAPGLRELAGRIGLTES
jgi:hypothetical protein